jgi:predicted amidohydrolase
MKIALVQSDVSWGNISATLSALNTSVENAARSGATFIALPEMFPCGFSFLTGASAQAASDAGRTALTEWTTRFPVTICGSLPTLASVSARPRNSLCVFRGGQLLGQYDKTHLFTYAQENEHYDAGDSPLSLEINGLRVSFFICYDLRFPAAFAALADQTELFVVCANWPAPRTLHWRALLTARAIESQCYVAGVNRVGNGGGLEYSGDSLLVSPKGETLLDGAGRGVAELVTDINRATVDEYRAAFPALQDRRREMYQSWQSRNP